MSNTHRGQVPFKAGEREFTLSFSINSTCELEEHFDLPIAKIADKLNDLSNIRMSDLRAFIWAALLDSNPDITMKEAGDIATEAGITSVMTAIGQCFAAAFPPAEGPKKPNPRKAAKA